MIRFDQPNDPNAARLIESLRHVGYGNYEAIADLVDNSFDAEASRVVISVSQQHGDFKLVIGDDGIGMDRDILDQALRLGSLTERNASTDLGKFGMGLVTASLSLSRCVSVTTKQGGDYWTSIIDVDEIVRTNTFLKHLAPSNDADRIAFDNILGGADSGTVVVLSKTDGLTNRNTTQFANILRKTLGEVHRHFLFAGKRIIVNDQETAPLDPLVWDDPRTERFSDDIYPVEVDVRGEKTTENIRVRIALVPEDFVGGDQALGRGLQHQGFYVLRNNRQIHRASTLDLFTKHNDFNRMRGEIFFSGELDKCIGIEFTKRQVIFDQAIHDKLGEHLRAQCRTIKRRESGRGAERTSVEQDLFHQQASKAITEKSRLLITPKAIIEKRSSRTERGRNGSSAALQTGRERKHFEKTQKAEAQLRCRFVSARLGPNGQIFECDLEGRTVVIRWNIEHPFYRRFVIDNQHDGKLVTAADFLVYSLACAELRARDEDNIEFISNFKAVMSANLRTLLN